MLRGADVSGRATATRVDVACGVSVAGSPGVGVATNRLISVSGVAVGVVVGEDVAVGVGVFGVGCVGVTTGVGSGDWPPGVANGD